MSISKEYQHFIPQFLIKNYAYPFKCSKAEKAGKKKCKCKHEKGMYPNDLVVNCVNLLTTPFSIEPRSVKRIFGSPGMYHDPNKPTTNEQHRIERMFGRMESSASSIFRRIVKSQEDGDTAISLTRIERDLIRKFFFLLKYRGSTFHQRFYHESADTYNANDRDRLLSYMKEGRFSNPRDVWYHNLEAIMNLKMDAEGKWRTELPLQMFPDDARWFTLHVSSFYMAICTPLEAKDEFILTDNCYNVFEGPNTFMRDERTGEVHGSSHASFHEFAPVSPRLVVVLRSFALPNPREDMDPTIKKHRQDSYWAGFENIYGSGWKSILQDLPIEKATNSYTQIIAGHILPATDYDGRFRPNDKFTFQYYRISSLHVQTINNIFLENSGGGETLAFRNYESFFHILESYVSGPCDSFKIVGGPDTETRFKYLKGLESLIRIMKSPKTLLWSFMHEPTNTDSVRFMEKQHIFRQSMEASIEGKSRHGPEFKIFEMYSKLSSTKSKFQEDIAQAGRMVRLQTVVEGCNLGSNKKVHVGLRMLLSSMFQASSCARYWIYLKLWRKQLFGPGDNTQDIVDLVADEAIRDGPEDVFAKTAHLYSDDTLNDLMLASVRHDFNLRKYHIENIWVKLSEQPKDREEYLFFQGAVFYAAGSIRHCGIRKVEILSQWEEKGVLQMPDFRHLASYPCLDKDEKIELMIRIRVRARFQAAMVGEAEPEALEELERVFFSLTFPTPPVESSSKPSGHPVCVGGRAVAVYY